MCEVLGISRASYYKALIKDKLPERRRLENLSKLLKMYIPKADVDMVLQKSIEF